MDLATQVRGMRVRVAGRRLLLHPRAPVEREVGMIHSFIKNVLPAERMTEAVGILGPMAERTRLERGCLGCHLRRDLLEKNVLSFEERWASEADLERHLRSHDYRQLLLVMELSKVPPEVRFDRVSHSTGLETIQQARD